jgi:predicted CopG family antitoxin
MCVSEKKTISVSIENYQKLKRYGFAGDSLDSAISKLFKLADSAAGGAGV